MFSWLVINYLWPQNKEGILPVATLTNVIQLTVLRQREVYIFKGGGVFIYVYKADDQISTSGATSPADLDLRRTYRAIDSVATGRIASLFCAAAE